jgi:hypothetical protein
MAEWYYVDAGGAQAGPVALAALRSAAQSKSVTPDSLCWNANMAGWQAMKEVPETKGFFAAPAPAPAARAPAPMPAAAAARGPAPTPAARGPAPTPARGPAPTPAGRAPAPQPKGQSCEMGEGTGDGKEYASHAALITKDCSLCLCSCRPGCRYFLEGAQDA